MSAAAIDLQAVRKEFGLSFTLGPLSLTVPQGAIYALIGPNGAGKSTTLNMLMGVGQPSKAESRCWVPICTRTKWRSSSALPS